MKSLEIIKDLIWKTQKQFDYVDFNQDHNQLEKELGKINSEFRKLQQIKQDLEVLEILQVLILHNGKSVGYKGIISDFEVMFRLGKITKEQLDKLKQWLEENDE